MYTDLSDDGRDSPELELELQAARRASVDAQAKWNSFYKNRVKGIQNDVDSLRGRLTRLRDDHGQRHDAHDQKHEALDQRISQIENGHEDHATRLDDIKSACDGQVSRLDQIEQDLREYIDHLEAEHGHRLAAVEATQRDHATRFDSFASVHRNQAAGLERIEDREGVSTDLTNCLSDQQKWIVAGAGVATLVWAISWLRSWIGHKKPKGSKYGAYNGTNSRNFTRDHGRNWGDLSERKPSRRLVEGCLESILHEFS
jgi:hypothetical protein